VPIVGAPYHVPADAVSVRPAPGVPLMPGAAVGTGGPVTGAATTAVGAEVATALPLLFVAVTRLRRSRPMSAAVTVYVPARAPLISVQVVTTVLAQRSHWAVSVIGPLPLQVPPLVVMTPPTRRVPVSAGAVRFAGATSGAGTRAVVAEAALAVPFAFVAVTRTRSALPTSAVCGAYVAAVAPVIAVQEVAAVVVQRCHWEVVAIGALPVHVPVLAVSVPPTVPLPLSAGFTVFAGATSGAGGGVGVGVVPPAGKVAQASGP
jgi:hypothetical protein